MQPAPFYSDVSEAPDDGQIFWQTTGDGVRIRLGAWRKGKKGTVLLFTGRTEFIEKYGVTIRDLADLDYATITLDWRGQGLSDRALKDRSTGHVQNFLDYQHDVAALLAAADRLDMPRPYFLISHSMGGAIGLRALHNGLDVRAAVFSAPMWGILISPAARPIARLLATTSRPVGLSHLYAPGTSAQTYVATAPYADNLLTSDREMYEKMQRQVHTHPDLALGGPSLGWLHEALSETRKLARMPSPEKPVLTFLGTNERIVDTKVVVRRMQRWENGRLEFIPGAEHEVLMERPKTRRHIYKLTDELFSRNS